MSKFKQYFINSKLLMIVVLFVNIPSYATEDATINDSREYILFNKFYVNQCAFVERKGDIVAEKECFNIVNYLLAKFPNNTYSFILGGYYFRGIGVTQDVNKGLILYEKVATSNSELALDARVALGSLYLYGDGDKIKKNLSKAEYWYKKAAIKNYARAQSVYAEMLEIHGRQQESWYWYKKAAKNGYVMAKYKLGSFFNQGYEIGISRKEAYQLLHDASDQNFEPAFQTLWIMYEKDGDKEQSNYWRLKFANSEFIKKVRGGMTPCDVLMDFILKEYANNYLIKLKKLLDSYDNSKVKDKIEVVI